MTLETIGAEDFGGTLRCEYRRTPKVDEQTGELFFFDYGMKPPYMRYGVVGPDGAVGTSSAIDLPGPRLPHDMAITEHHAILMDLPLFQRSRGRESGAASSFLRPLGPEPLRRHPALRRARPDPLVRGRAVLHLPLGQRLGRRRRGRAGRLPGDEARAAPDLDGPLAQMLSYLASTPTCTATGSICAPAARREEVVDDDNTEFPSINRADRAKRRATPTTCTSRRRRRCSSTA